MINFNTQELQSSIQSKFYNEMKNYEVCFDGEFLGDFICSEDCFVKVFNVENIDVFENYIKTIKNKDCYELYFKNKIDDNIFYTFKTPFGMLHTYYTDYSRTVRLVFDSLNSSMLPPKEDNNYLKATDPSLTVMSLDYKRMVPGAAYGMSYVFTLSDGSYVIYDGGLWGDADHLIDFLENNNKRQDGNITVAAWIITHSHDDHYECLKTVLEKYADKLDVEKFVFNEARKEYFQSIKEFDDFLTTKIYELADGKFKNLQYVRLHTGQRLYVRDCVIEAFFTHEDLYPSIIKGMNSTSLITKVYLGGQTFMFLADEEGETDKILPKMYYKAWKSDFVQVTHHGYSAGTDELYDLISPDYAMWPTAKYFFDLVKEGKWEKAHSIYLLENIKVKEAFIGEGGHKTLILPYNKH
jgi:beta-lactamase superfamily II metal-dependent hydrolase